MENPSFPDNVFKYNDSLGEVLKKHNITDQRTTDVVKKLFGFIEKGEKDKAEEVLRKHSGLSTWFPINENESKIPLIIEDISDFVDLAKMGNESTSPLSNSKSNNEVIKIDDPELIQKEADLSDKINGLVIEINNLRLNGELDKVDQKQAEFQDFLKEHDIIKSKIAKLKKPALSPEVVKDKKINPSNLNKVESHKNSKPIKNTLSSFEELKQKFNNMPHEKGPNNRTNPGSNSGDNRHSRPFEQRKEIEFNSDGSPRKISGYSSDEVSNIIEKVSRRKNKTEESSKKPTTETSTEAVNISKQIKEIAKKFNTDPNSLNEEEKKLMTDNLKDFKAEVKKIKDENKKIEDLRTKIAESELDNKNLDEDDELEKNIHISTNGREAIDELKSKISNKRATAASEAAAAKTKADAEAAANKVKAEREAFGKMDRAGKRAKAMERYQKMVDTKTANMNESELADFQYQSQEKRDNANARRSAGYEKAGREYQEIISNKEYQKLKSDKGHLGQHQKEILAQYENRLANAKKKVEATGPLGSSYLSLEDARADLAKYSQEYKHSFERKFIGSRALAGISNMFGFKYSGIKEGKHTKDAQHHMVEAQAKYDNLRQKIMQGTLNEEYDVNKVIKLGNENIADRMRNIVSAADKELIVREHQKLEDLKHVLEETVKKPAFLQFANWYKNNYWGAIKNERVRRVVQRTTNALVLSGAIFATGGLAGVAVGVAGGRALVSGAVGESAAAGVAGLFGGTKNARGEFEKFAAKRDEESKKFANIMNSSIREQIMSGNKPDATREIFRNRVNGEERAAVDMQMREMRLRKGEMWTRLITGGAMAGYLMHELVPGPNPSPLPVPPKPTIDDFKLEGDFVDASSRGSIQSFMNLKQEMINHYKGIDAGQFKYPEANEFAGLTDDQVVEKLLATGKFDAFTKDIMSAHTLKDFMNVAEQHGFWKPEGWGNSAIDSASIPAGSKIGMDIGDDGMMHYKIILPDGKSFVINKDFQEALTAHLKGAAIIDTHAPGSNHAAVLDNSGAVTPGPAPVDSSLDPGDMPASTNTGPGAAAVIDARGTAGTLIESGYFENHPIDFSSRLNAYNSLIKNGYTVEVQGDGFTPMQVSNVGKIQFDRAAAFIVNGDKYFLEGWDNVPPGGKILQKDFIFGMDNTGHYVTMDDYDKFHHLGKYQPTSDVNNIQTNVNNIDGNTIVNNGPDDNLSEILTKYDNTPHAQEMAHNFLDKHFGVDVGNDDVYGTEHLDETKSALWNDLKNEKIGHVHNSLDQQGKVGAEKLAFDDGDFYNKAEMKQTNVFFNELVERYKQIYGSYPTSEKSVADVVKSIAVGSAGSSR